MVGDGLCVFFVFFWYGVCDEEWLYFVVGCEEWFYVDDEVFF